MLKSAFNLGEKLKVRDIIYYLYQAQWNKYNYLDIDLSSTNWTTIKYLNAQGNGFNADIDLVPNNTGGLYLFSIKCHVIPGITEYPVYVGRAKLTNGQNLRKRCRDYFTKIRKDKERPLISKMFKFWKKELYLSWLTLDENEEIVDLEKDLINGLLLPFNEEIPDIITREAKKAFKL